MMGCSAARSIVLADRAGIEELYLRYGRGDSAHAFQSLYIWQEEMGLSVALGDGAYAVRCRWKGEGAWFFPVGSEAAKAAWIDGQLSGGLKRLCYMTRADAAFLVRAFPDRFEIREAPEDSEYLYDRAEMLEMPGKPFSKIRNRYRRLEKGHVLTAQAIDGETLPLAADIARLWSRNTDTGEGISDDCATARILDDWEPLGLGGVLLRMDGEPWAVAAGYPLSGGVFDCCLMKARENLPGVTDHLRAALARSLEGSATRLNFEEDMGVEGLRQMKSRLRPCGMIDMYTGERR